MLVFHSLGFCMFFLKIIAVKAERCSEIATESNRTASRLSAITLGTKQHRELHWCECRHESCLVHLSHCTNSVITIFGKMSTLAANQRLAVGFRNFPCLLTHGLFLSLAFAFAFAFGLLFALVTLTFTFVLALSLGLTFALDDSVNFHIVRASVPVFLRAQVTLDRLYHFLLVGVNFF